MLLTSDLFVLGILILIIGCVAASILKARPFQIFFWGAFYVYVIMVLGITLFPIPYEQAGNIIPVPHNFVPFKSIISSLEMGITRTSLMQIGGNILISAPYGVTLYLTLRKRNKAALLLLPFLFPIVIELLQLFIGLIIGVTYRSFDIDDFILNSLGAYLGIGFSGIFLKKYQNKIYQKLFPRAKSN